MRPVAADYQDMRVADVRVQLEAGKVGRDMHQLITELYPICRSITGDGVRETLRRIGQHIPLSVQEVASGTPVFDWTVPKEWNIRDAYIKDSSCRRVVDFKRSNLHVVNYSIPVHRTMSLEELKPHLHILPEHPDWIPYRTSYYKETLGFCLSHRECAELATGEYEVCIDSCLQDGHLTYGQCYLPGETSDEVLFSSHVCHPSLFNDNLRGISLSVFLAKYSQSGSCRYSFRLLFAPATIGSITWWRGMNARPAD